MHPLAIVGYVYAFSLSVWIALEAMDALLHLPGKAAVPIRDPD